jgi:hypothetical protein
MSEFGFAICVELAAAVASEDLPVIYVPKFREFGIENTDGGSSYQLIAFCPYCGERLPEPLRDDWFEAIERLDLEPEDPGVPIRYATDEWWRT